MSKQTTLDEIISMTERMLGYAQSAEWNKVISIEATRQNKLQEYFSIKPSLDDAEWIKEGITSIVNMDKKIMELGSSDLDKLGNTLSHVNRGKKAQFAYQKLA